MCGEEGLVEIVGTISWEQCRERVSFAPYNFWHRYIAESELVTSGFDGRQPLSDDCFETLFGRRPYAFAGCFAGFFVVVLVEDEV